MEFNWICWLVLYFHHFHEKLLISYLWHDKHDDYDVGISMKALKPDLFEQNEQMKKWES